MPGNVLCLLAAFLLVPVAHGLDELKEQALFESNLVIATQLRKKKPRARFVMVGRSPTALDALFSVASPGTAYAVPLSLRGQDCEPIPYPPAEAVRDRIYRQFDRFFPPATTRRKAEIVLVDYFDTGGTLFLADRLAQDYLRARNRTESVSIYGLGAYTEGFLREARARGIAADAHELEEAVFQAYDEDYWKERAAYPSFRPETDEPTTQERPSQDFERLVADYRSRFAGVPPELLGVFQIAIPAPRPPPPKRVLCFEWLQTT